MIAASIRKSGQVFHRIPSTEKGVLAASAELGTTAIRPLKLIGAQTAYLGHRRPVALIMFSIV
jgi:hypothetical protein